MNLFLISSPKALPSPLRMRSFPIRVVWQSGDREVELLSRFCDPVRAAADRGVQAFDLPLPAGSGARIELRADPGTVGDARADLTAFGGVEFQVEARAGSAGRSDGTGHATADQPLR